MITYSVNGLLVGPYIPSNQLSIDGVTIVKNNELVKWETPKGSISAHAGDNNDSLITFTPSRVAIETSALLRWETQAKSSKEASEKAKMKFGEICDSLSIGCFESRYFFQLIDIQKITNGVDPESPMADPLHAVSYETVAFTPEFEQYVRNISAITDKDGVDIIRSFGESLRKYDSLGLYQVMEKITHVLNKEVRDAQDIGAIDEERKKAIETLRVALNDDGKSINGKAKLIKTTAEKP